MKPPIADPFAPPAPFVAEESRVFQHSFWRVYVGTLLVSLIGGPLIVFVLSLLSGPIYLRDSGRSLLFVFVVLCPFLAAFSARLRPTKVTARGIHGPFTIGFVEWERMKKVDLSWFGVSYIQIQLGIRSPSLMIPFSFRDAKSFARTIEEWAPADNPLRLFLEKHNF